MVFARANNCLFPLQTVEETGHLDPLSGRRVPTNFLLIT